MPSPIYPGYYPGKPLYRDTRYVAKAQKVREVKLNALERFLSGLYENANLPRWVYEQELKTMQESLVIKPESQKVDAANIVAFGIEDLEEMKGAAVRVPLNPRDWFENPLKVFWETYVAKPFASIADWDEYRATAKGQAWGSIIGGQENVLAPGVRNPYELYYNAPGPQLVGSEYYGVPGATPKGTTNPAKAAVAYMQDSTSSETRNKKFHEFNVAAIKGWTKELLSFDRPGGPGLPASLSAADRANFQNVKDLMARRLAALASLDEFTKISSGLVKVGDRAFSFSVGPLGGVERKIEVPPPPGAPPGTPPGEITVVLPITNRRAFEKSFISLNRSLQNLDPTGSQDAKNIIAFRDRINSRLFSPAGTLMAGVTDDEIFKLMRREIKNLHRSTINGGLAFTFSKKTMDSLKHDPNFVRLLNATYIDANGNAVRLTSDSSRNLFRLTRVIDNDWEWEALGDTLTDLSEGKVPYQVIWKNFVLPRVERYTPSFWVGKLVKNAAKNLGLEASVERYQKAWGNLQIGFLNSGVGKVFLAFQNKKELIKAQLVGAITNLISGAIAVATDGLSLLAERVIRVAVRIVVNKISKFTENVWKAIKSRDFDILDESFKSVLKIVAYIVATIFVFVFGFMLLIAALLSAFSVEDATKVAVSLAGRGYQRLEVSRIKIVRLTTSLI